MAPETSHGESRNRWWPAIVAAAVAPALLLAGSRDTAAGSPPPGPGAGAEGRLRLEVRGEGAEGRLLPCRVHLRGPAGKPVEAPGLPFFHDHFDGEGAFALDLAPGSYRYTVARGPEYRERSGEVRVEAGARSVERVRLERWIDLAARGWWSGDLHVHRPVEDIALLMRAEDLHIAPVLTQWNQRNLWATRPLPPAGERVARAAANRLYGLLAAEDERGGGALLYFDIDRPLDLGGSRWEFPSPTERLRALRARADGPAAHVDIEKPFWRDAPTWVATSLADTIGIANNHQCRSGMLENEAWGEARDRVAFPPPRGNGFWSQEIWYRLLDCGFFIPPSAGSASGVLPNPVGYDRVYVHLEGELSWPAWFRGLRAGRSFVSNGPVLLVEANGRRPGELFRVEEGGALQVELDVRVGGADPIEAVEVVRDGEIVDRLERPSARDWLRPTPLRFEQSGWFVVRAIAAVEETFRFASTAPFRVEVGRRGPRIDPADARFFIAWIDERVAQLRAGKGAGGRPADLRVGAELDRVLAPHLEARRVFEARLEKARAAAAKR